ncbi:16S rRNA (cytosine(967)-C(5))-methyltransferase RsmB [Ammoniphilus sp. CFH 90114]|uniref:16S rRNA (cytosine(967)-C(5))-methyltransferase RsmB n=1 Tax=Ammoniphilus sp. CFH 90114 TaxID=2493665 RepID=UPI00100F3858|nr:16S rRNA (cytosine(967)-C(5))-methyltransferase RsmB [Ammoniphilus sp. CFH 90114]RXT15048.1 16S rRNA (cytosine(967)-C(5))-methyltransferase RsmB [Ammoniphilus sp. CFH 90114]
MAQKTIASARSLALQVLTEVQEQKAFSNLQLNAALRRVSLDRRDAGLATELVYGTLSRLNTLDWILGKLINKPLGKLETWVINLLRLSLYQLHYLDKIPERAVVHEAVELAKQQGHKGTVGLVNGVLRNYERRKQDWVIPEQWPKFKKIALEHSHPEWLVKRWLSYYGEKETIGMCEVNNQPPSISIRVNRLKASKEQVAGMIQEEFEGAECISSKFGMDGFLLRQVGNIAYSQAYQQGLCTIQDESSMLVAIAVAPEPGMSIMDTCAAPGGKTTHMAELMNNSGHILALDIHEHKIKLITSQAERLGIDIIQTKQADARELPDNLYNGLFDRILVDAPCSGFGVIRRKPDLKWQKRPQDIEEIAKVQLSILKQAAKWLKPGGYLVYSTCTVDPEENSRLVHRFLEEEPSLSLDSSLVDIMPSVLRPYFHKTGSYVQLLPHQFGSDGFFISRIKRHS